MQLAKRTGRIRESATLRMARLARSLRQEGIQVLDLSLGEPDFPTPAHIQEAAKRAMEEGYTHYPPVAGFPDLRDALAEYTASRTGQKVSREQVLVTAGAKQALAHLFHVLADEGEEVLIPAPCWVSYPDMAQAAGLTPRLIQVDAEAGYRLTPEGLLRALQEHPRARILILNSPCNPTGVVYTEQELQAIFSIIARQAPHLWVISDEVYEHLVFEGICPTAGRFASLQERLILVNSFSKAYAMTGWRVGWMVGPPEVIQQCERLQGQTTAGACSISQRAALAALTGPREAVEKMKRTFQRRIQQVLQLLNLLPQAFAPLIPAGTFYLWVSLRPLQHHLQQKGSTFHLDGDTFAHLLLENRHVSVVGGNAFGDPAGFRISCATSDEILVPAVHRILELAQRIMEDGPGKLS